MISCGRSCPSCGARSRGQTRPWRWSRAYRRASCLHFFRGVTATGSRILACGLGQGRLCVPPARIHYRPVRLPPYQFQNTEPPRWGRLCVVVEMRGVEPLSENRSMRLSPGAASDQISLWTISDAKSDTGSHFVRDRFNGEPPMHGHRYMTFSLGSRYSRGERAAL